MTECKELIEDLRKCGLQKSSTLGWHSGLMDNAADAIEQLVKERDDEREAADEWQHKYFELARKCSRLKKERGAAVEEFPHYCQNCKNSYLNNPTKTLCKYTFVCGKEKTFWEWRGIDE